MQPATTASTGAGVQWDGLLGSPALTFVHMRTLAMRPPFLNIPCVHNFWWPCGHKVDSNRKDVELLAPKYDDGVAIATCVLPRRPFLSQQRTKVANQHSASLHVLSQTSSHAPTYTNKGPYHYACSECHCTAALPLHENDLIFHIFWDTVSGSHPNSDASLHHPQNHEFSSQALTKTWTNASPSHKHSSL